MKKMKTISAILLVLLMIAGIAACGDTTKTENTAGPTNSVAPPTNSTTSPTAPPAPPTSSDDGPGEVVAGDLDAVGVILWPGDIITPPANAQYADTINITTELGVSVFDPQSSGSTFTACRVTFQMVYDRLTYYDVNGVLQPELATSWETADQQTWIFHLRNDVYFHNGDKFTAQDVINTCEGAQSPSALGSLSMDQWRPVTAIRAIDDYTVEMVLNAPYNAFAYNLAMPGGAIINKSAREADPVRGAWVGTGPFKLTAFESSATLTLTRNDDYWGTKALTKTVNLTFVPEMAARTVMQMNNESDVAMSVSSQDNQMFLDSPDHYLYAYCANSTHSLTFSMINPITGDYNFRMAVACAINREEAAMASSGIWAKPTADGAFWGDSTPFRNTSIPRIEQNIELAKEYLAKSPYNGEELTLITAPDTLTVSSQMLQEQLRVVGINVKVQTMDVATLVGSTQYGDTNMELLHFVSPFELNPTAARVMLYPGMTANRATYNNEEVNALLDQVITVGDPAEQQRIYYRIQEIVASEIPQLSIFEKIWTFITNSRVGGVILNPDMNHDLRGIFMTVD